ncbi:MAG TPA: DUF2911 domain-containing protein [Ohtaekwangia sp.]|nr:DUF2911 domain-containing protein [Ohtaekwangia sp.]
MRNNDNPWAKRLPSAVDMKISKDRSIKQSMLLVTMVLIGFSAAAQDAIIPRPSPLAIVTARYKDSYLRITYSQPHKKGREIFGELVPYGKVWRTGANEATEITITKAIQINGTLLKAGTYSLFTIPNKEDWTIIINQDVGLWGAYNYNEAQDVMRFKVPVTKIPGEVIFEPFTIQIDQRNEVANLLMLWDKTRISIPIKFI